MFYTKSVFNAISIIVEKLVSLSSADVASLVTKESDIVKIANALTLCFAAIVYKPAASISTHSTPYSAHNL